jgi:hypothetical protein
MSAEELPKRLKSHSGRSINLLHKIDYWQKIMSIANTQRLQLRKHVDCTPERAGNKHLALSGNKQPKVRLF